MPVQLLNIQVNTSQRWRSCFIDASNCRPIYRFQLGNWNQDATGVVGTCRRPPRHPRHGVGSKLVCAISGWEMSICDFWFGLRVKLSQRMMHNVAFGCLPQVCDGIWVIDAVLSIIFYFNDSSVTPQWCNQSEISIFDSRCRSSRIKNHHCLMLQHFNSEIDIVQIDCHSMLLDMLKLIETDGSASTQVQMDQSTGVEQTLGVGKADRNSMTDLGKKRHR